MHAQALVRTSHAGRRRNHNRYSTTPIVFELTEHQRMAPTEHHQEQMVPKLAQNQQRNLKGAKWRRNKYMTHKAFDKHASGWHRRPPGKRTA